MADRPGGPGRPTQFIQFFAIRGTTLAKISRLPRPLFVGTSDPWRQLHYIDRYIRHQSLDCRTVVVEDHYIDRDHMEDHSVFYSKNLRQYPNSCHRLHFFDLDEKRLRAELKRLQKLAASSKVTQDEFSQACEVFSRQHYLGFAVIKPLPGCPVGRTVVRCLPMESGKGHRRLLNPAFDSAVHFYGLPLVVCGLPFQQQDLGVSACATTALWTSLQNARRLEQGGSSTPAQITMRASQFTLPFGRPMPSPGLSTDQMCQAVQSLGYSPNLYRAEPFPDSFVSLCAMLHSAVSSGLAPVLIVELQGTDISHAIAVAGMAISDSSDGLANSEMGHASGALVALYVHDDRNGPYVKAEIRKEKTKLLLHLRLGVNEETWALTHILIPMHAKIRLSFPGLYQAGLKVLSEVQAFLETDLGIEDPSTFWASTIVRSHGYVESLLRKAETARLVTKVCETVPLPRYLGVIHVVAPTVDPLDVLIDTTSTERNLYVLGVVQLAQAHPETRSLCEYIARKNDCSTFN